MKKDKARAHVESKLSNGETLIGCFIAQKRFKIWLFALIGPLAVLSMKHYIVAVTDKGVHFHMLNLAGKFAQHDVFAYHEIASIKIGNGALQIPMRYIFTNGRKLKIRAQKKGVKTVAIIDEPTLDYLRQHITQAK